MRKELSPTHEIVTCEVCGRTLLKGERTEAFVVPDGSRRLVCDLCTRRAEGAGWIRESAHAAMPTAFPRAEPRRSLLGRLRRRRADNGPPPEAIEGYDEAPPDWGEGPEDEALEHEEGLAEPRAHEADAPVEEQFGDGASPEAARPADEPPAEDRLVEERPVDEALIEERLAEERLAEERTAEDFPPRRERRSHRQLRDPRHVRAIPTNAEARVERGLELFNASEYRRTVAGLVRTLGDPWVTALPVSGSNSEVTIVVAWELSWYQYRVELDDTLEPVTLVRKGQEIDELDEEFRRWNVVVGREGALASGTPAP